MMGGRPANSWRKKQINKPQQLAPSLALLTIYLEIEHSQCVQHVPSTVIRNWQIVADYCIWMSSISMPCEKRESYSFFKEDYCLVHLSIVMKFIWHLFWALHMCFCRYKTIVERILKARLVYGSPNMNRAVSFEYMNRQLVWNEFSVNIFPAALFYLTIS
jgi:hypothetical protein